jgi:Domain of unknown function (DUF4145)
MEHVQQEARGINAVRITMRCPVCLCEGTLDQRGQDLTVHIDGEHWPNRQVISGERLCPNSESQALIYVVYDKQGLVASYPPERIDFDASQLPDPVKNPLEEAVECHAHESYPAAAVMVRRALEAVCADQKVSGDSLYQRIEGLGKAIVLPKGMIAALHNLRLLGNDAVHVEARVYAEVGKREVEIAIDVAKTILQATYQMDSLLDELEELKESKAQGGS